MAVMPIDASLSRPLQTRRSLRALFSPRSEHCVAGSGLNLLGKRAAALQTAGAARVKPFRLPPQRLGRYEFKTARTDGADAARGRCSTTPSGSQ